ncbi:hypothetical protein ACXYTJ_00745 [Gilvimarinus sp. F26214L]|uniref:hypothetical protein n=1 Tax=Gilvimarinus sp. DZF01 TaxID=3461371 RepID=UPI00404682DD
MSIIRSEQEAALNDLLVSSEKSVDHYQDAAEYLRGHKPSGILRAIAGERQTLVEDLQDAVRATGDLPSAPDEDRESVEKLLHRVHASLSEDEIQDLVRQRMEGEGELLERLSVLRRSGWENSTLMGRFDAHLRSVRERLQDLLARPSA